MLLYNQIHLRSIFGKKRLKFGNWVFRASTTFQLYYIVICRLRITKSNEIASSYTFVCELYDVSH